jgi:carbon storage regulator CsrA
MLVLGRKLGEKIVVPQCRLTITVSAIHGNMVRLAISAPVEIGVYREEVWLRDCQQRSGTPNLHRKSPGAIPNSVSQGGSKGPA